MTDTDNSVAAIWLLCLLSVIVMLSQGRYGMALLDLFTPIGAIHGIIIIFGWIF